MSGLILISLEFFGLIDQEQLPSMLQNLSLKLRKVAIIFAPKGLEP